MEKILTKKEWMNQNNHLCKFEHICEDQSHCYECGGLPSRIIPNSKGHQYRIKYCSRQETAYKKYLSQYSDSDMILVLMEIELY